MVKEELNIGLIGLGTIGAGVAKLLLQNATTITNRAGISVILRKACDLDVTTDRGVDLSSVELSSDANFILEDDSIDVVVEVIGGVNPAKPFIEKALKNGKHVVTSNKEVIAKHGRDFTQLAKENGVNLYYEASCGGGVPIIHGLKNCLSGNKIKSLFGIVNGTTNFILSKMTAEGADFEKTLKEAQDLGFAEAEPSADVDGYDIAYKLSILASIAFGSHFSYEDIEFEGMRDITPIDIASAEEFGYVIKMLAIGIACDDSKHVELRVHPVMVQKDHALANVNGPMNAVFVEGDFIGECMFYGPGAGQKPTASAVVGDIMDLAMERSMTGSHPSLFREFSNLDILPSGEIESRYFLRMEVEDRPGVLSTITKICGDNELSIKSVHQNEQADGPVPLHILTHKVKESNMRNALSEIEKLDAVSTLHKSIKVGL